MTTIFPRAVLMLDANYEQIVELRDTLADNQLQRIDDMLLKLIAEREARTPGYSELVIGVTFRDNHNLHVRRWYWWGRVLMQCVWDNGDIRLRELSSEPKGDW